MANPLKNANAIVVLKGRKFVDLPYDKPPRHDGKWARERGQALIETVFPNVPLTKAQNQTLIGLLSGWTSVARNFAHARIRSTQVLVDDPRLGVDSFIMYMDANISPELGLPEGINNYDIHGTPLAAPRITETLQLPAGPAAYSYSHRRSSFTGRPAITRNVEYFIMLKDYGMMLTFHYQWADPNQDEIHLKGARQFAEAIEVLNRD